MKRSDLQALSRARLREARVLFRGGQYSGAYYLAGYSIECALKACIARQTERFEFPEKKRVEKSYSHSPRELIKVSGLETNLQGDMRISSGLAASWDEVCNWSEQSRYSVKTRAEAKTLIEAIVRARVGILPWIRQHW